MSQQELLITRSPTAQSHSIGIGGLVRSVLSHRGLIRELAAQEMGRKYEGSLFGSVWFLLTPIFLILIYTTVFGLVFKVRTPAGAFAQGAETGNFAFGVYLFSGLLIFTVVSEILASAPSLITSHPNFVTKVVFPLEILPLVTLMAALAHALIAFVALLVPLFFVAGHIPLTAVLYPLIVMLLVPMLLGCAWMLSALGVYLRDINHLVGLLLTGLLFISPIFTPLSNFPPAIRWLVMLNPVSIVVELCRWSLFGTEAPDWQWIVIYALVSLTVMGVGWAAFQKMRSGFADVI